MDFNSLVVEMASSVASMEKNMDIFSKIRMEVSFDPVIPLLGIYPPNIETLIQKETPMFTTDHYSHDTDKSNPDIKQQEVLTYMKWNTMQLLEKYSHAVR